MERTDVAVVISAAGRGTRLGLGKPKCLAKVCGRTIIEWQLKSLRDLEVPTVVVVGYRAQEVIEFVAGLGFPVTFAFNPDYETTGTAASLKAGALKIKSKNLVSLDGDLLIHPSSMRRIVESDRILIGVSEQLTTDGVRVETDEQSVRSFGRELKARLEWSGVFKAPTQVVHQFGDGDVYPNFNSLLPLSYFVAECCEIDTPSDLDAAKRWMLPRIDQVGGKWIRKPLHNFGNSEPQLA